MEGRGSGSASRCYVNEVHPLSNLQPNAHQMEFGQQHHEENLQGLISFMVASHEHPLLPSTAALPFKSHPAAVAAAYNPSSKNWCNEKVGTSDPEAGSNTDHQNISAGRDGVSSWWKSSAPEKGKIKVRRKTREPRFCFQTRSDVDVLDDGYKWRKYGQKIVKNSLHPRSYFRCTHHNCRVKKRVERLSQDCRMVITTYEGRHTHTPSEDINSSEHECFSSF